MDPMVKVYFIIYKKILVANVILKIQRPLYYIGPAV